VADRCLTTNEVVGELVNHVIALHSWTCTDGAETPAAAAFQEGATAPDAAIPGMGTAPAPSPPPAPSPGRARGAPPGGERAAGAAGTPAGGSVPGPDPLGLRGPAHTDAPDGATDGTGVGTPGPATPGPGAPATDGAGEADQPAKPAPDASRRTRAPARDRSGRWRPAGR
jgi:hypothetical protein